jgi:hypothetical protein
MRRNGAHHGLLVSHSQLHIPRQNRELTGFSCMEVGELVSGAYLAKQGSP